MHSIIVMPFPAPDETIAFERRHKFSRHAVVVPTHIAPVRTAPAPIVAQIGVEIDCDPKGMGTQTVGAGDSAPVEASTG